MNNTNESSDEWSKEQNIGTVPFNIYAI